MIDSVVFRDFKALRDTQLTLERFNLLVGPNGSGKSSLLEALLRLRTLARLPLKAPVPPDARLAGAPEIRFALSAPFQGISVTLSCVHDRHCDLLEVHTGDGPEVGALWPAARERLLSIRAYLFDHYAMALPAPRHDAAGLSSNGGNLAAVLARWQQEEPAAFAGVRASLVSLLPEYDDLQVISRDGGTVELALRLTEGGDLVLAEALSQGTLYAAALCLLAHEPHPPAIVCIEEVDRGLHPRLLRRVRDVLYQLSHPEARGLSHPPVQVLATTHSPYLLDLFRDHPEEVVIAEKHGTVARFTRLAERTDLLEVLGEGSLGDLWFAGVLGGVPDEH